LRRAQKAGVVRSDISFDDIVCLAIAVSLATEKHDAPKPHITHLVGMFIDGIGNSSR
jgi:hypothetical protein